MNRRNFLKAGLVFPMMAYAALPPAISGLVEGATPAAEKSASAPIVASVVDEWPQWQFGDFISYRGAMNEAKAKALLLYQAKETFATLQVPDASSKIEYVFFHGDPASTDPWLQKSTAGWKVTIPAPAWMRVLYDHPAPKQLLAQVLKTRKRFIPISLNGRTQMIPRNIVRDQLRFVCARLS